MKWSILTILTWSVTFVYAADPSCQQILFFYFIDNSKIGMWTSWINLKTNTKKTASRSLKIYTNKKGYRWSPVWRRSKGVKKAGHVLSRIHRMKRMTHLVFLKSSWESAEATFHYLEKGISRYACLTHSTPMYNVSYGITYVVIILNWQHLIYIWMRNELLWLSSNTNSMPFKLNHAYLLLKNLEVSVKYANVLSQHIS